MLIPDKKLHCPMAAASCCVQHKCADMSEDTEPSLPTQVVALPQVWPTLTHRITPQKLSKFTDDAIDSGYSCALRPEGTCKCCVTVFS